MKNNAIDTTFARQVMGVTLGLIVAAFFLILLICSMPHKDRKKVDFNTSLEAARKNFKTNLERKGAAPALLRLDSCPPNAQLVTFLSGNNKLKAYLYVPQTPGKHKAVVFAHGGFSLGADDFTVLSPFINSDFVVIAPSLRAENGNPGAFELCFGEVDDLKSAVDYLCGLPQVDDKNIYAFGHSVGGTNVALLAEMDPRLKKVAACGAYPDLRVGIPGGRAVGLYEQWRPFESNDEREYQLRSFGLWTSSLKCPLLLCYGENDPAEDLYCSLAQQMQANSNGKVRVEKLVGRNHFTALEPSLNKVLPFFQQ